MLAAVKEAPPVANPEQTGEATAVLPAGSPVRAPDAPATAGDPPGAEDDLERLICLGRMVSAVSHELGNRLTSVLGFAEMAAQAQSPGSTPRLLAKMNNYAENLRVLVESLSGFSSHRMASKEECDPAVLLRQVVELASCVAKTSGVQVVLKRQGNLPLIRVVVGEARLGLFMCLDALVRDLAAAGEQDAHLVAEVSPNPDGGVQVVFRPSIKLGCGNGEDPNVPIFNRAKEILTGQGITTKWAMRDKGVREFVAEFSREVCAGGR